jgi:hypothetical protein
MTDKEPRTEAGRIFLLDQAATYVGAPDEVQRKHDWYLQAILAIEVEASQAILIGPERPAHWAAAPAPALDVELLRRAMSVSLDIYGWDLDSMAREIAAEYVRLAAQPKEGEG